MHMSRGRKREEGAGSEFFYDSVVRIYAAQLGELNEKTCDNKSENQ